MFGNKQLQLQIHQKDSEITELKKDSNLNKECHHVWE